MFILKFSPSHDNSIIVMVVVIDILRIRDNTKFLLLFCANSQRENVRVHIYKGNLEMKSLHNTRLYAGRINDTV